MLVNLNVRNFTLVDHLELSLEPGMTAITGETGAGKSILLDALSLTLGDRADYSRIRKGADRAEVFAQFDIEGSAEAKAWLANHELDADGECLLRRSISASGKSSAWINGHLVTLNQLRDLAEMLISIHSQHEHQALTRPIHHRQLLDQYADHPDLLESVQESFANWKQASALVEKLESQSSESRERLELLSFQVEELSKLHVQENEYTKLEQEQKQLANAESILKTLGALLELLEEQDKANLQDLLQQSLNLADQLPLQTDATLEARELLKSASIQIEEATASIRRETSSTELDPERLAMVEDRVSQIFHMSRKYGKSPEELAEYTDSLQQELTALSDPETALEEARKGEQSSLDDYKNIAEKLSKSRQKAAKKLVSEVNSHFDSLSMKGAEILFNLELDVDEMKSAWGSDRIELLVRTNPGQSHGSISKIASGGELSRISLAIQVVTAQGGQTPSLIFDEVDVGIGGATADTVGNLLLELGTRAQVICITHLAQVASKADQQLRVSKQTSEDSAQSLIETLDQAQRIDEVARMLGGAKISEKSRENAKELLSASNA